jgi:hypothetical protein
MKTAGREAQHEPARPGVILVGGGPVQFVEADLAVDAQAARLKHGYARYADLIARAPTAATTSTGRSARRGDGPAAGPHAASLMAGELTSTTRAYLKGPGGRDPPRANSMRHALPRPAGLGQADPGRPVHAGASARRCSRTPPTPTARSSTARAARPQVGRSLCQPDPQAGGGAVTAAAAGHEPADNGFHPLCLGAPAGGSRSRSSWSP